MLKYSKKRVIDLFGVACLFTMLLAGCAVGAVGAECVGTTAAVGSAAYQGCVDDNVRIFKGIKYATAERWRAPEPYTPSGSVPARNYGWVCVQKTYNAAYMNEDCLSLNIWAPSDKKNRPVMVFIHGGAFLTGTGADPTLDGTNLVRDHNIVVVTFNYRLGPLGSYYKGDDRSGNFGMLDQTMALKWVHENIRAFGGDPEKVTIVGESAGSMSVGIQLGNEAAVNYFRGAILESSYYGFFCKSSEEAARLAQLMDLYREWWCGDQPCPPEMLIQVQEKILTILNERGLEQLYAFTPYMDNVVMKKQPIEVDAGKPVILGENAEESLIFTKKYKDSTPEDYTKLLNTLFGSELAQTISSMPRYDATKQEPSIAVNNLINDAMFVCGADYVLGNQKSETGASYGYDFTYVTSYKGVSRYISSDCEYVACHIDELPLVFDNISGYLPPPNDTDIKMARRMGRFWTHFVKRGDPGTIGKAQWNPYEGNGRYILMPCIHNGYTKDAESRCDFWAEEVYKKGGTSGLIQRLLDAVE